MVILHLLLQTKAMTGKKLYLGLMLGLVLTACSSKIKVTVDNPLKEKLLVKVDNENFTLEGEKQKELLLGAGEHTFETHTEKEFLDKGTFWLRETDGLLNVSHSSYILWKEIFSIYSPSEKSYNGIVREDTFEMDGKKYWGPFVYFSPQTKFIPKQWEYDVIQSLPDTLVIPRGEEFKIYAKLYRKKEFIDNYKRQYEIDTRKVDELLEQQLHEHFESLNNDSSAN